MSPLTIGAIDMRPTGNDQGGHYFMILKIGCLLNRNNYMPLPIPSEVIEHVHIIDRAPVGPPFIDINNVNFLYIL